MSKNIKKMSHFIPLRFRLGISGETFLQGETHKRQAKDSIFLVASRFEATLKTTISTLDSPI